MPHKTQGSKVVDAAIMRPVPATAAQAMERSTRQAAGGSKDHTAERQAYREPSARPHPALKHLTSANHVQEVFKKRG
jgi:hypothetical protein